MNKSKLARIEKLEEKLKNFSKQTLWIDLIDNRVCIDMIGSKHIRGEEVVFDSVIDCLDWVDSQIAQFDKVTGLACISDISEVFAEGWPRMLFHNLFEFEAWTEIPEAVRPPLSKGVILNLASIQRSESLSNNAFFTWWHVVSRDKKWREEAERRLDIFYRALVEGRDEGDEPMP